MSLKTIFAFSIICLLQTSLVAQLITRESRNTFNYQGEVYSSAQLANILESDHSAKILYKEYLIKKGHAKNGYIAGTFLIGFGGFTTYHHSKNDCLEGHCIPGIMLGMGIGVIGVVFELFAINNDIKSRKKLNKAVELFNENSHLKPKEENSHLNLKINQQSISLIFNF